jgi:hypothetical protein
MASSFETHRFAMLLGTGLGPTVPDDDSLSSSWPDLFRPSTSWVLANNGLDARDRRGHDESVAQGRWYQTLMVVRSRALRGVSNREVSRDATMIRANRKTL